MSDQASDPDWLTWPQAAELVGCPVPTIETYVRTGRIEKRSARPSSARHPSTRGRRSGGRPLVGRGCFAT